MLRTPVRRLILLLTVLLMTSAAVRPVLSQTPTADPGTNPVPADIGWDQEALNAVNTINAYRAQQQPPVAPLQVDGLLQRAAAWMAYNQAVTLNCLADPFGPTGVTCDHNDTLGRDPFARERAFGYQFGTDENRNWGGVCTGQGTVQGWITLDEPHRLALINPASTVVGVARHFDAIGQLCVWYADFGSQMVQAFVPPAGGPPLPAVSGPTQPAATQPATTQPPATTTAAATLSGAWNVDNFGQGPGGTLTLTQTGNQVTGTYSYPDTSGCGTENGTLTGTVTGQTLSFTAQRSGCGGNGTSGGILVLAANGASFAGGTVWNGTRAGAAVPAPTTQPAATAQPATATPAPTTQPAATAQPATATPAPITQPAAPTTGATLTGTWTIDDFGAGVGGTLVLVQNGIQVTGTYSYADPTGCGTDNGTLTGTVVPGDLSSLNFSTAETGCNPGSGITGNAGIAPDNNSFFTGGIWDGTRTGP